MTFTRSTFTSVFKQGTRCEKSRDCNLFRRTRGTLRCHAQLQLHCFCLHHTTIWRQGKRFLRTGCHLKSFVFHSNVFFVSGIKLRCTKLRPKLVLNLLPISQRNLIQITLNQLKRYNNNNKNNNKYMALLNADIGKSQFQIGTILLLLNRYTFADISIIR